MLFRFPETLQAKSVPKTTLTLHELLLVWQLDRWGRSVRDLLATARNSDMWAEVSFL